MNKICTSGSKPIILIGEGCRTVDYHKMIKFVEKLQIPVLSSMTSQDIIPLSKYYFGYIGSNGSRVANHLLEKATDIISLGNRMSFNKNSQSFKSVLNKRIIKVDIDRSELVDKINSSQMSLNISVDDYIENYSKQFNTHIDNVDRDWIKYAEKIEDQYKDEDISVAIVEIGKIMSLFPKSTFVGDAGINEKYLVRSYYKYRKQLDNSRLLIPNTFGLIGHALPTAIGVAYAQRANKINRPIIAFIGDQGFQYNLAELENIKTNNLPIYTVIIDNSSSGLIEELQIKRKLSIVDVNRSCGYNIPKFEKISYAYDHEYTRNVNQFIANINDHKHTVLDLEIPLEIKPYPLLPFGNSLDDMFPVLQ